MKQRTAVGSVTPMLVLVAVLAPLAALPGCPGKQAGPTPGPAAKAPKALAAVLPDCTTNLKGIAVAVTMYAMDYKQALPTAKDSAELAKALAPYLKLPGAKPAKGEAVFECPEAHTPYLYNTMVAGKPLDSVATQILLKDGAPHADGKVTVCFVSGTVQRMAAADSRLSAGSFK